MRTIWAIILLMTFVGVLSAQDALQLSPPLISVDPVMFEDSARVRIDFGMKQSSLYYELDGEIALYTGPFYVTSSQHISASARANGFRESEKEHALAILASDVEIQLNESTSSGSDCPISQTLTHGYSRHLIWYLKCLSARLPFTKKRLLCSLPIQTHLLN